jgi:hypothetical protein
VKRALLAMVLMWVAAIGWPLDPVTIELHHRSAESLITVLRPLAAPAALTGSGTRLQVRAAPRDLARVTRLVQQSDRPLRPLAITLRNEPPPAESNAPAGDGSITLSTGHPLPQDPYGNGQVLSTQPSAGEILEGDPLLISMPAAQSLRFRLRSEASDPKTAGSRPEAAGVVNFDAVSDFTARIWLAGEAVAIELQPRWSGRVAGSPDQIFERLTAIGRVGQWIALADPGTSPELPGAATPRVGLWIKVRARPDPD